MSVGPAPIPALALLDGASPSSKDGALAVTEGGKDSFSASGSGVVVTPLRPAFLPSLGLLGGASSVTLLELSGSLEAAEVGGDAASVAGSASAFGSLEAEDEGSDSAFAFGEVAVAGDAHAYEAGADTLAAAGTLTSTGEIVAVEVGSDVAALSGGVVVTVPPAPVDEPTYFEFAVPADGVQMIVSADGVGWSVPAEAAALEVAP